VDPVTVEVLMNLLYGVAEEMWSALGRSAYSVNIKERRDCSSAIFTASGEVVALPEVSVPIHLSSMDGAVAAVLRRFGPDGVRPGDMFIANDPYDGGGAHLPDLTLVAPIYAGPALVGFVANIGHHSDVGGHDPGSMSRHVASIFDEGLRLPPVRICAGGAVSEDILAIVARNSRLPREREGDLRAQIAANRLGLRRLEEILARYSPETVVQAMASIIDYSEARLRRRLREIPDGTAEWADVLDDEAVTGQQVPIHVRATKAADSLAFDFSGTAPHVASSLNVPLIGLRATVLTVVKTMLDPGLPPNAGLRRPIAIVAPEGSLVNPPEPAAVAWGVQVCNILADAVAGALSQLVPEEAVAGSGLHWGWRIAGRDPRAHGFFIDFEVFAGAVGATAYGDGLDAVRAWTGGSRNAPVEAIEHAYPLLVTRYELRPGSEGAGRFRGGLGIRRDVRIECDEARVSLSGLRHREGAPGLFGGRPGLPGEVVLNPGAAAETSLAPAVTDLRLRRGDVLSLRTPGGGGLGPPRERDRAALREDLREGRVLPADLPGRYGLSPDEDAAPGRYP
jgi:N-methylhydantoinase B